MDLSARQRKQSQSVAPAGVEKLEKQGSPAELDLDCNNALPLLSYDQVPEWYRDNPFIRHGYRPVSSSTGACLASWFYLHNETVNIFSHLVPATLFLVAEHVLFHYFQSHYPSASIADHLVFAFFLLTATICLGFSAMFHTLMNHSADTCNFWLQLDFIGIVVLTLGDFVSGIHLIFDCEPSLKRVYWTMIVTLALMTILLLVNPRFQGRQWRTFRVCAFIGTGLSGFAPIIHGVGIFGVEQMLKDSGMPFYLVEGFFLLLGALIYTTRIPERFKPGYFDTIGSSHQIFHLLVVLATATHFIGILSAFDYKYHHRACVSCIA